MPVAKRFVAECKIKAEGKKVTRSYDQICYYANRKGR